VFGEFCRWSLVGAASVADAYVTVARDSEGTMSSRSELIDVMIEQTPDWRGETLASVREIIHSADPDIVEDVKWIRPANPIGSATFEHDGIVCIGVILKERVRLSFWDGASLPDPHGLFNAQLDSGKSRAIDIRQGEKLQDVALTALIRAGVEYKLTKAKPVRKGRTEDEPEGA
jgi:hypothetical protein